METYSSSKNGGELKECVERNRTIKTGYGNRVDWFGVAEEMNKRFAEKTTSQWSTIYNNSIIVLANGMTRNKARRRLMAERSSALRMARRHGAKKDEKQLIVEALLSEPKSIGQLAEVIKSKSELEALGYIETIRDEGIYSVSKNESGKTYSIEKRVIHGKETFDYEVGADSKEFKFMAVSDPHIGSRAEQITYIKELYKYAKALGIKHIFNSGDMTDGYYRNRPEQTFQLVPTAIGFDEQAKRVINNYPKIEGITTHFIIGNHDETHIKNGGANIGEYIAKFRPDMEFLGNDNAYFDLKGIGGSEKDFVIELLHPWDGTAYSLSYKPQKRIEFINALPKTEKRPNIVLEGHYHKSLYIYESDIHFFLVPATCGLTDYQNNKTLWNVCGAWIIMLRFAEDGSLASISPEFLTEPNFLKDDWRNYE